jgi:hypothetical protein
VEYFVLSHYAWVVPLKDKTGKNLKEAFEVIFKLGRQPIRLQTDRGTEFTNRVFPKFLKENNVDTVVWLAHVTSAGGMPMVL